MRRLNLFCLAFMLICTLLPAQEWRYAGHAPRTKWSEGIKDPNKVNWEYPRPQMLRSRWLPLNGIWDYIVTYADVAEMPSTERRIFVPFPLESALSGAGRTILERDALWYSRTFEVPQEWRQELILLHFDGVEKDCEVYVNGSKAGEHKGGGGFVLDVTRFLSGKGPQRLVLKVYDGRNDDMASVTGIWQSVWMEPVNRKAHIDHCEVSCDATSGSVSITPKCINAKSGDVLKIYVFDRENIVAETTIAPGQKTVITIPGARKWTFDSPYLYDFTVNLIRSDKLLDIVRCYVALRDEQALLESVSDAPVAETLLWSDGNCTPPADDALYCALADIRRGSSSVAPRVKYRTWAPTARCKYWCDVLGLLMVE